MIWDSGAAQINKTCVMHFLTSSICVSHCADIFDIYTLNKNDCGQRLRVITVR